MLYCRKQGVRYGLLCCQHVDIGTLVVYPAGIYHVTMQLWELFIGIAFVIQAQGIPYTLLNRWSKVCLEQVFGDREVRETLLEKPTVWVVGSNLGFKGPFSSLFFVLVSLIEIEICLLCFLRWLFVQYHHSGIIILDPFSCFIFYIGCIMPTVDTSIMMNKAHQCTFIKLSFPEVVFCNG